MKTAEMHELADDMVDYAMELADDEMMETILSWAAALYDYLGIPEGARRSEYHEL